jgi:hypothetical protein
MTNAPVIDLRAGKNVRQLSAAAEIVPGGLLKQSFIP